MNSASVLHGGAAVGASRRQPLQEKLQFKNINDKKSNISKSLCENYPNGCSRESGAGVQPSAKLWHRRDLRPPPPPPLPPALLVATGGRDPAEEDRGPRTVRRRKYREKLLIRPPERTNAQTNDDVNWPTVKTTSGDNIFPTAPVREGGDCEMSHLTLRLDGREPRSDWKDLYHPPGARATEKCAAACQVTAGLLEKENSTDPSPEDLTVSSAGQTRWTQDTNESPLDVENSPALQRHYFVAVATCGGEEGSPSGERGSSRHSTAISRDVQEKLRRWRALYSSGDKPSPGALNAPTTLTAGSSAELDRNRHEKPIRNDIPSAVIPDEALHQRLFRYADPARWRCATCLAANGPGLSCNGQYRSCWVCGSERLDSRHIHRRRRQHQEQRQRIGDEGGRSSSSWRIRPLTDGRDYSLHFSSKQRWLPSLTDIPLLDDFASRQTEDYGWKMTRMMADLGLLRSRRQRTRQHNDLCDFRVDDHDITGDDHGQGEGENHGSPRTSGSSDRRSYSTASADSRLNTAPSEPCSDKVDDGAGSLSHGTRTIKVDLVDEGVNQGSSNQELEADAAYGLGAAAVRDLHRDGPIKDSSTEEAARAPAWGCGSSTLSYTRKIEEGRKRDDSRRWREHAQDEASRCTDSRGDSQAAFTRAGSDLRRPRRAGDREANDLHEGQTIDENSEGNPGKVLVTESMKAATLNCGASELTGGFTCSGLVGSGCQDTEHIQCGRVHVDGLMDHSIGGSRCGQNNSSIIAGAETLSTAIGGQSVEFLEDVGGEPVCWQDGGVWWFRPL